MTTLHGHTTWKGLGPHILPLLIVDPGSTVQNVVFERSDLRSANVRRFLAGMPSLRTFTYQHQDSWPKRPYHFCAREMCDALQEVAGNTLESLDISLYHTSRETMAPLPDLQAFKNLKNFSFELRWLIWMRRTPSLMD